MAVRRESLGHNKPASSRDTSRRDLETPLDHRKSQRLVRLAVGGHVGTGKISVRYAHVVLLALEIGGPWPPRWQRCGAGHLCSQSQWKGAACPRPHTPASRHQAGGTRRPETPWSWDGQARRRKLSHRGRERTHLGVVEGVRQKAHVDHDVGPQRADRA